MDADHAMLGALADAMQTRHYGKYRGRVERNLDPGNRARLQVKVPALLGDQPVWAMPCVPYAGKGVGLFALPPVGSGVWVEFEGGDLDYPIWSGCFWADGQISPAGDAAPHVKFWKTDAVSVRIDDQAGRDRHRDAGRRQAHDLGDRDQGRGDHGRAEGARQPDPALRQRLRRQPRRLQRALSGGRSMAGNVQTFAAGVADAAQVPAQSRISPNQRVRAATGTLGTVADVLLFPGLPATPTVVGNWILPDTRTFATGLPTISRSSTGTAFSGLGTPTGTMIVRLGDFRVSAQ